MPGILANGPKDGDYVSLIHTLEEQSLRELQRGGAKPMHEGPQTQSAILQGARGGALRKSTEGTSALGHVSTTQSTSQHVSRTGAVASGKGGINIIVYIGITLALVLMFVISGDPEFGIFCAAAFIIVSVAFFSSRKASARRGAGVQVKNGSSLQH